jgi:hypothetical protein
MTWIEIALLAALLIGIAAGVALILQRPSFWVGLGTEVVRRVTPVLIRLITKRMSPEDERRMQDCYRRGGHWNNFKKRCE